MTPRILRIVLDEQGTATLRIDERAVGLVQSLSLNLTASVRPQLTVIFPEVMENPTEDLVQENMKLLQAFPWIHVLRGHAESIGAIQTFQEGFAKLDQEIRKLGEEPEKHPVMVALAGFINELLKMRVKSTSKTD